MLSTKVHTEIITKRPPVIRYARLSILKEHIQRDHGEGPKRTYNCKECPATFVRRRSLYYHMNMKHDKDNRFRLVGWRI